MPGAMRCPAVTTRWDSSDDKESSYRVPAPDVNADASGPGCAARRRRRRLGAVEIPRHQGAGLARDRANARLASLLLFRATLPSPHRGPKLRFHNEAFSPHARGLRVSTLSFGAAC